MTAENDVIHVPTGWITPLDGYFMSVETGRDVLTAWTIAEKKVEYLEQKIEELLENQQAFIISVQQQTENISIAADKALAEKDRQIRAEKARARRPGFGVFAGGAYTGNGDIQAVVGMGIVWKIF